MLSEMPGRVVEPSAQMGQLLLRGFAMLADVCDDCQYPLMRDPQTMVSHCVSCRRIFDEDGNPQDHPAAAPAAPAITNGPVANGPLSPAQPVGTRPGSSSSSNNGHNVAIGRQQPADPAAAAAAANGPVVLTYAAHMQQQQQHNEVDSEEERETAQIRQRLEHIRLQQQRQQRQQRAAAAANGGNAVIDPSQLLADKLLAGWAMLAQSCPICHTPLMRSRASEVRCIACDMPVVNERQQQQQQQQTPAAAAAAGSTAPASAAAAALIRSVARANGSSAVQQRSALVGLRQPNMFHINQTRADVQPPLTAALQQQQQQQQQRGIPGAEIARAGQDIISANPAAAAAAGKLGVYTATNSTAANATTAAAGGVVGAEEGGGSSSSFVLHEQEVLQGLLQAVLAKLSDSRHQLMIIPASQSEAVLQQLRVIQMLVQTLEIVKQAMLR